MKSTNSSHTLKEGEQKSGSHPPKKFCYLLQSKTFKNDEKCF